MDVGTTCLVGFIPLPVGLLAEVGLTRPQLALIAGIILITVTLLISSRRRKGLDAPSPKSYAREQLARLREENGIREDMEELLARVQDVARDLNAQLDTRFHKIERVLREADARVAQLERLIRVADGRPGCDLTVTDQGASGQALAERPSPPPLNPRHVAVYKLADQGQSILEIAQSTGQPAGEIELILALRPNPGAKGRSLSVCG
jgi:hypothetical protein